LSNGEASHVQVLTDVALDRTADLLHSVPFKDVTRGFRVTYTYAGLLKALSILASHVREGSYSLGRLEDALKVLDQILLMTGCPLFRTEVDLLISTIEKELNNSNETWNPSQVEENLFKYSIVNLQNPPFVYYSVRKFLKPPSLDEFLSHLQTTCDPIIIENAMLDWPATTTRPWSNLQYLLNTIGSKRSVPVEIGSRYTDEDWGQEIITIQEFIQKYILAESNENPKKNRYLAQHDLFSQIPLLRRDIIIPDYCYCNGSSFDDIQVNAWFGPAGTTSPLHTDPHHNLFAQIVGYKYIRLYAPNQVEGLYPFESNSMLGNTSQVDMDAYHKKLQ